MNIAELKEKIGESADFWIEQRIDDLVAKNPRLQAVSVYMKRGAKNYFAREKDRLMKMLDGAEIFLADKNGNVNMETVMDDAIKLFETMDEIPFDLGFVDGSIGKGKVKIKLPDNNFLVRLFFGDDEAIVISSNDFKELKQLIMDN